jgi:carboxyl-terminal processing protease
MRIKQFNKIILAAVLGMAIVSYVYAIDDTSTPETLSTSIPVDEINNFAKVYAIAQSYYVESVSDKKMIKGAINGMLTNLDPHSSYLDKDDFRQLNEMTTGSFAGLGIEVSREKDDGIKVVAPIDGTPAYKAGIKSGDLIVKIDNTPVSSLSLDEAIKKMRGTVGSKVVVTISRKGELKPLTFSIIRATISVKSIKYTMLTPNYAYIRITNFQANTTENLIVALKKLASQNQSLKGLVVDLRDDPGGLLQGAVGVAGAFLPTNSMVVYTAGRAPNSNQKFYAKPEDYSTSESKPDVLAEVPHVFKTIPMVVLVNQGTASASEIVSGALQDYKRAKIIGTTSFGKGSVQTVIPLSEDTAVKLTTALYYTPKGRSIQAKGIKPDVIVKSEYSDIYDSWDLSEANLDHHLDNPTNTVQVTKDKDNTPVISPPKQISTQEEVKAKMKQQKLQQPKVVKEDVAIVDLATDFQLQWALNILEGKPLPAQTKSHK